MEQPSITIAILTYKRPHYLATALRSACNQTVLPAEVLVVDDGSGSETRELVERFQKKFPFIRYEWKENGGHSSARNYAVAQCKTEFLIWLDDDDALTPNTLESHCKTLAANPSADFIYGRLTLCDQHLVPIAPMPDHILTPQNTRYLFFKHCPVPNPGTLTRMSVFKQIGNYNESYRYAEDYDFHARAASAGLRFVHNDTLLVYYRSHPHNLATQTKLKRAGHERSLIVQSILARENIEDIFYQLPWKDAQEQAFQQACTEAALLFVRLGDYDSAKEMLSHSAISEFDQINSYVIFLIDQFQTGGLKALRDIHQFKLTYHFMSEQFIDTLLDGNISAVLMDDFRTKLLREKIRNFSFRENFPYLPWEQLPMLADCTARIQETAKFARLGAMQDARDLLGEITEQDFIPLANFIEKLIDLFEKEGLNGLASLLTHPLAKTPLGMHMVAVLTEREERYKQIEREELFSYDENKEVSNKAPEDNKPQESVWIVNQDELLSLSTPILRDAAAILSGKYSQEIVRGSLSTIAKLTPERFNEAPDIVPLISIIIPTLDRPELLVNALSSVTIQNSCNVEVIIVNDGGNAFSSTQKNQLKATGLNIKLIECARHAGPSKARNVGAKHADGDWFLFLDDDDELAPGALNFLTAAAELSGAPFVYGDHVRRYFTGQLIEKEEQRTIPSDIRELLGIENAISCGSFIVKRKLFHDVGGYRHDLLVHEDYNLHVRLVERCRPFHIPEPVFIYNIRTDIARQNNNRRLFFYATAALNHALLHRSFPQDEKLKHEQRFNQYEQLARALREGAPKEFGVALIFSWWNSLLSLNLAAELQLELQYVEALCPILVPMLNSYSGPQQRMDKLSELR